MELVYIYHIKYVFILIRIQTQRQHVSEAHGKNWIRFWTTRKIISAEKIEFLSFTSLRNNIKI
jgi:hypothetical protein